MTTADNSKIISNSFMLDIHTKELFGKYLNDDNINEICYNGDNLIWTEDINGNWHKDIRDDINSTIVTDFATSAAKFRGLDINEQEPILSCLLSTGERVQIVVPPAVARDKISITIRKPSKIRYTMQDYIDNGSLDLEIAAMLKKAVENGKNLIICGETGSGKTTFMKTLTDFIPTTERIITIEDVEELSFKQHENVVGLFYPSEAKDDDFLRATTCLKSCLRMKPSRILLAELRGAETYDFLNVVSSGHNGSITSCHAGSVKSCFNRIVMMSMQNRDARIVGKDMILDTAKTIIDMVIVFKRHNGKRQIMEYLYNGKIYERSEKDEFHEIGVIQ